MKSPDTDIFEKRYGRAKVPVSKMHNTKEKARASGHIHYFTGKPCKNGHIAPRFVNGGRCCDCNKEGQQKFLGSKEGRARSKFLKHRYWEKNKEQIRKKHGDYRKLNKEALLEADRSYYQKNRDKILAKKKQKRQENYDEFFAKRREYKKQTRDRTNQLQRERYRRNKTKQ